jgi:alkanesulfonate monooxygenase SsuD/methylene tetrahydromethanopterin reductase-like flavin-dependent oxidoreductase (luciferase family)
MRVTEAGAFREGLSLVDATEAWDLDSAWLAEFHFSLERLVLSSPIAAAMAAWAKRIRISLAAYVWPLNKPLRIAEEAATVYQLSGGRLDFGIERSGFVSANNTFNIYCAESQGCFEESPDILRLAWLAPKFSHDGKYYKITDVLLVPRPIQRPTPSMWVAESSPGTFKTVAEQGLSLFFGLRGDGLGALAKNIEMYLETWQACGYDALVMCSAWFRSMSSIPRLRPRRAATRSAPTYRPSYQRSPVTIFWVSG